ncbi:hypothetical protein ACLKA6_008425 [Drosophila palustris]
MSSAAATTAPRAQCGPHLGYGGRQLLLLVHQTRSELGAGSQSQSESESSDGMLAPQPARTRIKAKAENMSTLASNIRHGRSRAHMLYNSNNNNNSTRLTLVSSSSDTGAGALSLPLPLPIPTQQSGTGGTTSAPVTHKIRKLHKKKINESIRKSVDKSLGVVRPAKNHRSLAEAEHLQGRPTDVDDEDDDDAAALDEVMQLADEIDLENSLVSAYQNVVADVPDESTEPSPSAKTSGVTARQFVRANSDDANYENSDEDDELSTTQIATFAPRQAAPNAPRTWSSQSLQQTRNVARTRLLPVKPSSNSSNNSSIPDASSTGVLNVNLPVNSDTDYRLEGSDSNNGINDDDDDDDDDEDDDDDDNDNVVVVGDAEPEATNESVGNSTDYAIVDWPEKGSDTDTDTEMETEMEARSQASTSEGIEIKQINFNLEPEAESNPALDTSEVTMDDGYPPEVVIDDNTKQLVIGDVDGNADGDSVDSNQITADVINARDSKIDLVSKFLQYIEQQHLMGSNCVAGTSLNLGEGVVDRYAQDRFRVEAEVAVNRANMLTR